MFAFLQQLLAIALLRAGPQDLPADPQLPLGLAAAYALVGGMVLSAELGFGLGMAQAGLDALLLAGFTLGVLKVRGYPERFLQTYTALLGVNLLLALLSWPLIGLTPIEPEAARLSLAQIGLLVALLWSLVAQGQVLRTALETGAGVGLLLAFVYFLVASLVLANVFPAGASA